MDNLFFVYAILLACSNGHVTRKRVISSHIPRIDRNRLFEYDMIRYNTWIGAASSCTAPTVRGKVPKFWVASERKCLPDVDDQRCGGALIHPRIVQTAGHCVGSHVLSVSDPHQEWAPGKVWSVWEDYAQVFVGYIDVEQFYEPSYSRVFLLHPKYARLRETEYNWVSHDYGWIILNTEPYKLKYWSNLVAPVRTTDALVTGTQQLLKNEEVCLFAGFGAWQLLDKEIIKTTSSRYLRYGWQVTTSYVVCWWFLHYLTQLKKKGRWKYKDYATWFCHIPFGDHADHPGVGDSGSPVHCNGAMLALVSGGRWQPADEFGLQRMHVTRTMGLAYSIFENSADFRAFFVATLKWYSRVRNAADPLTFRPERHRHRRSDIAQPHTIEEFMESGESRTIQSTQSISMLLILSAEISFITLLFPKMTEL